LDESQKKDSIQNCPHEIDTVQKLSEIDIKQEIKEECVYLDEEEPTLPYKYNSMVWIPSLNLPMINESDKSEQHAVVDKISLFGESVNERTDLEKYNESSKPNDIKSSAIVLDLTEIAPLESNANLSSVANEENAISNSNNCLLKDFSRQERQPRITELITKEQKETIEQYYKVDLSIVDKKEVERNMTIREKTDIRCNICFSKYSRRDKCEVS
jgi:hypothetical protein